MMKRLFDLLLALVVLIPMVVIGLPLALMIRLTSKGPAIHWSKRIGQGNHFFYMAKFRTMYLETPDVATHLLKSSESYITPIGKFLRKSSLDELPQLWNILKGEMSFVGPRPALFNQDDLKELRTKRDIHLLRPGLTGWAQINGRDENNIPEKVDLDDFYLKNKSLLLDLKIIFLTFYNVIFSKGIKH